MNKKEGKSEPCSQSETEIALWLNSRGKYVPVPLFLGRVVQA